MDIFGLFPKNHFGSLTEELLREIKLGNSCLLFGAPGSGGSYFLQFLRRQIKNGCVLSFESGLLGKDPITILTKEILSQTKEKKDLNLALSEFTTKNKLIICISALYELYEIPTTLQFLNSLRKANFQNVVIIAAMNHTIFGSQKDNIEFYGNFFHSRYLIPPFDLGGVERSIKINNIYYGWKISLECSPRIYELSGGNIRLVKYISKAVFEEGENILTDLTRLSENNSLKPRLNLLMDAILKCNLNDLKLLHLVDEQGKLKSLLLDWQFKNYQNPILSKIFPALTDREQHLINYFMVNKNILVSKERIELFMGFTDVNWSMWANYKAINRLQKKIVSKYTLKNIKGRGYILIDNNLHI